jgi:SAM-dependent methyltransferase
MSWGYLDAETNWIDDVYFSPDPRRQEECTILAEAVAARLALPTGARILDLCCGTASVSALLAARGYRVTGVDRAQCMIDRGRRRAHVLGAEIELLCQDIRDISGLTEIFDAVTWLDVTFGSVGEHRDDDRELLGHIGRRLAPGGKFLLEAYNLDFFLEKGSVRYKGRNWEMSVSLGHLEGRLRTCLKATKRNGAAAIPQQGLYRAYRRGDLLSLIEEPAGASMYVLAEQHRGQRDLIPAQDHSADTPPDY